MYTHNREPLTVGPSPGRPAYSATPGRAALKVWLDVTASGRPDNLALFLDELAWPDFSLDTCRESACLGNDRSGRYYGQWYCRFIPMNGEAGAETRLRERLGAPGIRILRFDQGP